MPNKKGFTLIEIIVVLIILGVLAAIAVPSLFSWVAKTRAAEGLASLKQLNDQMSVCMQLKNNSDQCYLELSSYAATLSMQNFIFVAQVPSSLFGGAYVIILRDKTDDDPLANVPIFCPGVPFAVNAVTTSAVVICHGWDGLNKDTIVGTGIFKGVF